MAIKYKEVKERQSTEETAPLNEAELTIVGAYENYIDAEINTQFRNPIIRIVLSYLTFDSFPPDKYFSLLRTQFLSIPPARKKAIRKEIENRYIKAGWAVETEYGEDDGPNRPSMDYWTLKGKDV